MYQPSLSKRAHFLAKQNNVIRKKKYEILDLDKMTPNSIGMSCLTKNTYMFYNNRKISSVVTYSSGTGCSFFLGEITLYFQEPWKFELWLLRRLLRAKSEPKYTNLVPKLTICYDLFRASGLGHKF